MRKGRREEFVGDRTVVPANRVVLSIKAKWLTSSKTIGAAAYGSLRSQGRHCPRLESLLHAQRDEAQFAFAIGNQQQHRLLAVLLELIDALLDVGGVRDGFLRHLDDDVAGG
jgi:hypothetical protein